MISGIDELDGVVRLGEWSGPELLGWSAAALRCTPYSEWVHPDDQELLAVHAERLLTSADRDRFWPVELRFLGRDRQYWWTRWHLWIAGGTDRPGELPSVGATGVEYVGRHAVPGPAVGTWRWEIDEDVVVWSPEVLDMFALALGPPLSYRQFLCSVDVEDQAHVDRSVRWTLHSGEPYVVDFRVAARSGGRDRWFHAAGRAEPATGNRPRQLVGIVKDLNPPRPTRRP